MLTVNHVVVVPISADACTKIENIYECERVTRCDDGAFGALELRSGDALIVGLWGGHAYVMNGEGKTVASYSLPDNPRPEEPRSSTVTPAT